MRNLTILAKWLAGRAEIDVVEYKGETACIGLVNGRRVIQIPSKWSYTNDPLAAELLEGILDHEALGHGRFTEQQARQKAEDAGLITFNNLSKGIQNILEDVYIENKAILTYPGVKANLTRMVEILVGRGFFGTPNTLGRGKKAAVLVNSLLNVLRARLVPGQDVPLRENAAAAAVLAPALLGQQLWTDVLAIAMEVKNSKSTADNIDLTVRVMKCLSDAAEQEPDPEPTQDAQPDSTENPQDDKSAEAATDEGESLGPSEAPTRANPEDANQDPQVHGPLQPGDAQDTQANGANPSSCPGNGSDGNQPGPIEGPPCGGQAVEGAGSDALDGGSTKRRYSDDEVLTAQNVLDDRDGTMPETEIGEGASAEIQKWAKAGPLDEMQVSTAVKSLSDVSMRVCSQVKSISDDLQDALLSQTRCEKSTRLVGKRLNTRVLARVRTGNFRVFRQTTEGQGLSTAVSLLGDFSSSMNMAMDDGVSRLDGTIGLIYGMGDILDEFSLPFEINAFSNQFATMKSFDDDWTQVRRRKERPGISGYTYTGTAMQKALGNLTVRPEDRKILVLKTDGDAQDLELLVSCYSEAQLMGIEIASVMIGPKIPSIEALASRFGFKAHTINKSAGLGRFVVDRILESI